MRERLTNKDWHKTKVLTQKDDEATKRKKLHKLWELENAEEQGLLVRLPCKVGDRVYMLVKKIPTGNLKKEVVFIKETTLKNSNIRRVVKDFGKEVFLTRSEAEKKLSELKGEKE